MRIVSNFNDYYDSVQSLGVDQTIVWQRKETDPVKVLDVEMDTFSRWYWESAFDALDRAFRKKKNSAQPQWQKPESVLIGFCGKLYPALVINSYLAKVKPRVLYNVDDVYDFFDDVYKDFDKEKALAVFKRSFWSIREFDKKVAQYFSLPDKYRPVMEKLFREMNTPIFVAREFTNYKGLKRGYESGIHVDPKPELKKFNFQTKVDPYTAYQEITMYVTGVLGVGEPETIDISDKHKRDAKGFNEMSFKTHAPGKKPRGRKKR